MTTATATACGDKTGTVAGYARHQRAKEPTCRACRDAIAANQLPYGKARRNAVKRLIEQHYDQFMAFLSEERQREGLE